MTQSINKRLKVLDGKFVDETGAQVKILDVRVGDPVRIFVDWNESTWIHVDPDASSDFVFVADGSSSPKLPPLAVFHGRPLPAEGGLSSGPLVMDFSGSETQNVEAAYSDALAPWPVGHVVDGQRAIARIEWSDGAQANLVDYMGAGPTIGSIARVKHRLVDWASWDDATSSHLVSPGAASTFKKGWLCAHDDSVEPVEIRVRERRSETQVGLVRRIFPEGVADKADAMVRFLETHVRHASAPGAAFDLLHDAAARRDADVACEEVMRQKLSVLMPDFDPKSIVADPRLVVRASGAFSDVRGVDLSIDHAARVTSGGGAVRVWKSDGMLRPSDSGAFVREVMTVGSVGGAIEWSPELAAGLEAAYGDRELGLEFGDVRLLEGRRLVGQTSGAEAFCELAELLTLEGRQVVAIEISDRRGDFVVGEPIHPIDANGSVESAVVCVVFASVVGFEKITGTPDSSAIFSHPNATWTGKTATHVVAHSTPVWRGGVPIAETPGHGALPTHVVEAKSIVGGARVVTSTWRPILAATRRLEGRRRSSWSCLSHDAIATRSVRLSEHVCVVDSETEIEASQQTAGRALHLLGTTRLSRLIEPPSTSSAILDVVAGTFPAGKSTFRCGEFTSFTDFDMYVNGRKISETTLSFDEIPFDDYDPYLSTRRTFASIGSPLEEESHVVIVKKSQQHWNADEPWESVAVSVFHQELVPGGRGAVPHFAPEEIKHWLASQFDPEANAEHTMIKISNGAFAPRLVQTGALLRDESGRTGWIDAHAIDQDQSSIWILTGHDKTEDLGTFCPITTTTLEIRHR